MSARLRLTLSYGLFLLLALVGMVALLVYITRFVPDIDIRYSDGGYTPGRNSLLAALWPRVGQVLVVLTVVGLVGGWFLAGYMLRPLKKINAVARQVAVGSLEHRVQLQGPADEFRELAETFNTMLDRLQHAFDEQRRFTANASHELRTPYAISRAILDLALADPEGQNMTAVISRLDVTNRRGIETVEALLALSVIEHADRLERAPIDMAETVDEVLAELKPMAAIRGISIAARIGEGDIDGNRPLVRQLAYNLVLNAVRHNNEGGWVTVNVQTTSDDGVELVIENSGTVIDDLLLTTLTEPFVRGAVRTASSDPRRGRAEGSGLGLALVARIAEFHRAGLTLVNRPSGGLRVVIRFPSP